MSTKITIDLGAAPAVITESLRCVLVAHGYQVCDARGLVLHPTDLEAVLQESGRNAAQSLLDLDETPEARCSCGWQGTAEAADQHECRLLHCWEDSRDAEGNGSTCMLLAGHVGPHKFTPDTEIGVSFADAAPEPEPDALDVFHRATTGGAIGREKRSR